MIQSTPPPTLRKVADVIGDVLAELRFDLVRMLVSSACDLAAYHGAGQFGASPSVALALVLTRLVMGLGSSAAGRLSRTLARFRKTLAL